MRRAASPLSARKAVPASYPHAGTATPFEKARKGCGARAQAGRACASLVTLPAALSVTA